MQIKNRRYINVQKKQCYCDHLFGDEFFHHLPSSLLGVCNIKICVQPPRRRTKTFGRRFLLRV